MANNKKGLAIATLVGMLFCLTTAPVLASANDKDNVICPGVNACKGQGDCKMPTATCGLVNQCKGQNKCKGKGYLWISKSDCIKKGSHGVIFVPR